MSSATTSALSRQPLAQVLRNITDPRDRRGVRHSLFTVLSLAVTGVLAGCRSLTAIWEHTIDLTPSDLRSLGLEAGQALPSAVDHPAGAAGPGPHRPQYPCEVVVVHSYRHRRGKNSHRGGRYDRAQGPPGAGLGTAPPVGPGPRHGRRTDPGPGSGQVQRDPRHQRTSRAPRPRRGSGHRRCHAHTGGHRPVDPRSGRPLRAHRQRQPEDSAQDAQGPALEEGPVRLERRCRPRAAGAAHRPRPSRHPSGWTSPQRLRLSRSDVPGPSRAESTLRWHTRVCSLPMERAQPEQVAAWVQGHWGIENRLHVGP